MTTPLERRYRRLLRLLPEAYRQRRGDELLGLLLDLDEGRTRPALRQSAGLVLLALRLRLPGFALGAFAVFLALMSDVFFRPWVLSDPAPISLIGAAPLIAVIAWFLGLRWVAVASALAMVAVWVIGSLGNTEAMATVLPLSVPLVLLAIVAWRRWRAPGPPALWLTGVGAGAALQIAWYAASPWRGSVFAGFPAVIMAVLGGLVLGAAVTALTRPRRRSRAAR